MNPLHLILIGACLLAGSGLPGLLSSRQSRWGEWTAAGMMTLAGITGLLGALLPAGTGDETMQAAWGLPWGRFAVALDPVSRAFLLPVFLIPPLGAIYGLGYWRQADHPDNGRKLRLFFGLLAGAMAMVTVANDGVLFLLAWEVMALSAFFLVSTEDDQPASTSAAWIYFVATHIGSLALFAMFAVLRGATGSFSLDAASAAALSAGVSTAVFVLALVGFGLKAGLMPLHVWLPGAHANAPSHISAVLSGVMLKMGIYGLIRMTAILPSPPTWWGATLLTAGAVSAVTGLVFAIAQHDLKRLLAYSSIENVGIITIGIGLALLGRSMDQPMWVTFGLGGAMLHAWNHSLFKPLLFFGGGSVLHGAGTRQIDQLGGLSRRMPGTAALFLVGCVAICALPPLNGFVSELLIYLGLFRTLSAGAGASWPAAKAPLLALVGGLAAVAFAKLFGVVFLGEPRSPEARKAHESPPTMLMPMIVLAGLCFALGAFPAPAVALLDQAIAAWRPVAGAPMPTVLSAAPLVWLPAVSTSILGASGGAWLLLRRVAAPTSTARPGTWDCGYIDPGPRMQYTGSSFAQGMVSLFAWALRPRMERAKFTSLFPAPGRFRSEVPDVVLDRMSLPVARLLTRLLCRARVLQQGQIQVYVLYVLLIVLALFMSLSLI